MQRSYGWYTLLVLAVVLAPLAGALVGPVTSASAQSAAPAESMAPNAAVDDEVIILTLTGQIRVDDPYTQTGYYPATWDSGTDTGWTMVAAGDFNGDGDAEIVAVRGDTLKVFDPFVQSGSATVSFTNSLGGSRTYQLLATGDFDGDNRDEIVAIYTNYSTGVLESLQIYDGGSNGTTWSVTRNASYNAYWQELSAGDVNGDGYDDVALVRNPSNSYLLIVYNGLTWATLHEKNYGYPWLAVAVGNLASQYPGSEVALTRSGVLGVLDSLILFRLVGTSMIDLTSSGVYKYYPYFTSLAMGDLNGDGEDELLMLRDPTQNTTSLLMVNPSGPSMRSFERSTGYGATAFKLVRTGDTDADGLDEVVIERSDRYRIYQDPHANDNYVEVTGAFYTYSAMGNRPTMALANVDGQGMLQGPVLAANPTTLAFNLEYGQSPTPKTISLTNSGTGEAIPWQAQITSGSDWVTIDKTSGTTPGTIAVTPNSSTLAPGTYSGTIRVTATGSGVTGTPQDISVSLTVTGVALSISPTSFSFEVQWGETSPTKTLSIASAGGSSSFPWLADVIEGTSWLHVSATSGTTPSTVSVTVDSSAAGIGTHTGTIRVSSTDAQVANSPQYVSVSLNVPDPGFIVTPTELRLTQKVGQPSIAKQFQVLRQGIVTPWVATAVSLDGATAVLDSLQRGDASVSAEGIVIEGATVAPPDWLNITPDTGNTPSTVSVSSDASTAGHYEALILVVALDSAVGTNVRAITVTADVYTTFLYQPLVNIN